MDALIDPGEYAALAYCTYLNQASLGLIPRTSLEASVQFLTDVAQHGNLRLSDQAEARVLDGLRTAAAELLGAPVASVGMVGGASEGLGQLAALLSSAGGEVVLVSSDFPSVTYPWLAAAQRREIELRFVEDRPDGDLTHDLMDAIDPTTSVVGDGTTSSPTTVLPSARSRGTSVCPSQPADPVTSTRGFPIARTRLPLSS